MMVRGTHVLANGLGHRQHILQVSGAIFIGRRAHCDKLHFTVFDAGHGIGVKSSGRPRGFP
jgi:hypothetical protein